MRLKKEHIEIIINSTHEFFGEDVSVYLFGSRLDDAKKGGDIDLYIETYKKDKLIENKIKLITALQKKLGDQKIDIVVNNFDNDKLIYSIAKNEGVRL